MKRIIRETFLTDEEAARDNVIRVQVTRAMRVLDNIQKAPTKAHLHLEPRYTCGSPAHCLDQDTVLHVANDEIASYDQYLTGIFGEANKKRAEVEGLAGIAYARWEKGKKVFRLDLITGEEFVEPPQLNYKEMSRALDLQNRLKYVGLNPDLKRELETLEYRAKLHRQEIK